ncbi:MAG TPA: hydrogenase maturation protease [Candidatus Polarisedimenticolaceae bacterium]|nr:hydrogenase maturation protease [Candidatus Polarisedimenticolaceae bacterium]
MSRRLLIGLGNPLAGDDGFGPAVVARLQQQGLPGDVEVVASCTDLLGRIDAFADCEAVVLVDAVVEGKDPPGTVAAVEESTLLGWEARSTSAHRLSPVEALRVFRALAPEAATRISLVALHTEDVGAKPVHARGDTVDEGARLVRALLS